MGANWILVGWLLCGMSPARLASAGEPSANAMPQRPDASSVYPHVRGTDAKARALLRDGVRLSPTFRRLVEGLEHSDVIAWVETRHMTLPGQLMFLTATGKWRHVRISINLPGLDGDLIAWLAHELQHAVEIAGAPEVRSQDTLRRLYERVGSAPRCGDRVESEEAERIWLGVRYEVDDYRSVAKRK